MEREYKRAVYRTFRKMGFLKSPFWLYASIAILDGKGFTNFIHSYCKGMVSLIIKEGAAISITSSIVKRRESLGLPAPSFDKFDIKKIALRTGLSEIISE